MGNDGWGRRPTAGYAPARGGTVARLPERRDSESYTEWSPGNPDYLARVRDVESLDLDGLRSYLRDLASHQAWIDAVLNLRGDSRTLRLHDEELYVASQDSQLAQLAGLWSFRAATTQQPGSRVLPQSRYSQAGRTGHLRPAPERGRD